MRVYSPYWLFSQTKTTGNFQIAAKLSPSWKAPIFAAPSPNTEMATEPVPRT